MRVECEAYASFVVCTPCCKKLGIGKDIRYDPPSMDVMSKTSVQTLFASTVRDCLSESGMSKPMLGRVVLSSKSFPKRCTHVYLVPFADVYVSDGTPIASNSAASHDNQLLLARSVAMSNDPNNDTRSWSISSTHCFACDALRRGHPVLLFPWDGRGFCWGGGSGGGNSGGGGALCLAP